MAYKIYFIWWQGERMKREMREKGISLAILVTVLYVNLKAIVKEMPPTLMAGFLYLGAGIWNGPHCIS